MILRGLQGLKLRFLTQKKWYILSYHYIFKYWSGWRDSNPHGHPLDPKSSASANFATSAYLVTHPGLEPGTPWLKVMCSTNWANGSCHTFCVTLSLYYIFSKKTSDFAKFFKFFQNFFTNHLFLVLFSI